MSSDGRRRVDSPRDGVVSHSESPARPSIHREVLGLVEDLAPALENTRAPDRYRYLSPRFRFFPRRAPVARLGPSHALDRRSIDSRRSGTSRDVSVHLPEVTATFAIESRVAILDSASETCFDVPRYPTDVTRVS